MSSLFDALSKKDKKGILTHYTFSMGYPTKLLPLDFRNGYEVVVKNKKGEIQSRWANIGLFGGSFITVTGKPGTAKTAFCVQAAAEICRPYKESEVWHLDIEGSSNITRMMRLSGFNSDEMKDKYHYYNGISYIEDIFELIVSIADEKLANAPIYTVKTKRVDEFGDPIKELIPTCIILDSIPMMNTKEMQGSTDIAGSTYKQRVAKALSDFYGRLRPIILKANIIVFAINHIKSKININPMMHAQAQVMYMKQDESLPGGEAPIYLTQNLFKFVQCGKFTEDKDGFNGFAIRCEFIKTKTNQGGSTCTLIYDMNRGFDAYRTLMEHIKEHELILGRNPYSYFASSPDYKFDSREFGKLCEANPELFRLALNASAPTLYSYLGRMCDLSSYDESNKVVAERLAQSLQIDNKEESDK